MRACNTSWLRKQADASHTHLPFARIHLNRRDFPQTLSKLYTWNLTDDYDEFVFADADGVFTGPVERAFDLLRVPYGHGAYSGHCVRPNRPRPPCSDREFVAFTGSVRPCRQIGWQSAFFVARTSQARFHSLLRRSYLGDFSPYTNGEQDGTPHDLNSVGLISHPQHHHHALTMRCVCSP